MESSFEYCIVNFICTKMCKDAQLGMSIYYQGHAGACMCGPGLNACKHLMDRQSNCSTGKINPCENVFLENDVYERETIHRIPFPKHKKHNCDIFYSTINEYL